MNAKKLIKKIIAQSQALKIPLENLEVEFIDFRLNLTIEDITTEKAADGSPIILLESNNATQAKQKAKADAIAAAKKVAEEAKTQGAEKPLPKKKMEACIIVFQKLTHVVLTPKIAEEALQRDPSLHQEIREAKNLENTKLKIQLANAISIHLTKKEWPQNISPTAYENLIDLIQEKAANQGLSIEIQAFAYADSQI